MSHVNSGLPLVEPFAFRNRSRDVMQGSWDGDGMLPASATTDLSDGGDFSANLGSTVSSFLGLDTYNGDVSGCENLLFAASNDWQPNVQPDFPEHNDTYATEEQWYMYGFCSQFSGQH